MTADIIEHYTHGEDPAQAIRRALTAAGIDMGALDVAHLSAVDEFHVRGRAATLDLTGRLDPSPEWRVLDIGSGLGGPARSVAVHHGCHVTGVDLTPAYVDTANTLTRWIKRSHQVRFLEADATELPFADDHFDAAMTFHAAMNIPGKAKMYSEARRVLKPGGRFLIYDIMAGSGGTVHFPTPWASDPSQNHLVSPEVIERLLRQAGFTIDAVEDSSAEGLAWFEAAKPPLDHAPRLSLETVIGPEFPQMMRNQIRNLREDRIRTVAMFCTA